MAFNMKMIFNLLVLFYDVRYKLWELILSHFWSFDHFLISLQLASFGG